MITLEKIDQLESISKQILENSKFTKSSFDKITISTEDIQQFFLTFLNSADSFLSQLSENDKNIQSHLYLQEIEDLSYQINLMSLNLTLESSKYTEDKNENISEISKNIQVLTEKIKTIVKKIKNSDEVSEENNNSNSINSNFDNLKNLFQEKEKYKLEFEHILRTSEESKEILKKSDSISLKLHSIAEQLGTDSVKVENLENNDEERLETETVSSEIEGNSFSFKTVTRKQGSNSEISKNFFEF